MRPLLYYPHFRGFMQYVMNRINPEVIVAII